MEGVNCCGSGVEDEQRGVRPRHTPPMFLFLSHTKPILLFSSAMRGLEAIILHLQDFTVADPEGDFVR